jgi:hypothetical protein
MEPQAVAAILYSQEAVTGTRIPATGLAGAVPSFLPERQESDRADCTR